MAIINSANLKAILSDFKTKMEARVGEITTVPTKVSELQNDSEFQTKTQVDAAIATAVAAVETFGLLVVDTLPTENIQENTIYLVPATTSAENNTKIEYLYVNGAWEIVGDTNVDLSAYSTTEQVQALIATATTAMTEEEVTAFNTELWA